MKRNALMAITALTLVATISACGNTRSQRVATGALGGAVAGQVVADEPIAGALIGGGIGAVN
ncbi:hypothetical protein [Falsirhodobacter algicola]|uniref:Osmotically inducible lipoprotein OsmB n=1 Tax=Falsirhodobacter algicola TaxID=2692330 RepID=A0A8J8MQX3_9RHOB|nr:hypothetical protein [Falsirhodobacter algicola]QUS35085.1 hypothetical protein GR316_01620 [Falsirhodobacter algicola]